MLFEDLRALLGAIDRDYECDTRPGTRVAALVGFATLTAEPVGDLCRLSQLLAEAGENDLVLTSGGEQNYHRVADWMNSALTGGDPLERWAW